MPTSPRTADTEGISAAPGPCGPCREGAAVDGAGWRHPALQGSGAPAKGSEVPGPVLLRSAHQGKPGVRRPLVQAHKGVALVVL